MACAGLLLPGANVIFSKLSGFEVARGGSHFVELESGAKDEGLKFSALRDFLPGYIESLDILEEAFHLFNSDDDLFVDLLSVGHPDFHLEEFSPFAEEEAHVEPRILGPCVLTEVTAEADEPEHKEANIG